MALQIVRANQKDCGLIAELLVASWQFAYKDIMADDLLQNLSVEQRKNGWEKHLASGGEAYLLRNSSDVYGVVEISKFRDSIDAYKAYGEIPVIYLQPDKIGQGHGRTLMLFALDLFAARGINDVGIWVLEKNKRAIDFYSKHGFSFSGHTKTHRPTGLVEWLMVRAELR